MIFDAVTILAFGAGLALGLSLSFLVIVGCLVLPAGKAPSVHL